MSHVSGPAIELEQAVKAFLDHIGEDSSREGLLETPARFVKQFRENTVGYNEDPSAHMKTFASEASGDLVRVEGITFASMCEHHLVPFFGMVSITYVPNELILGLSKFARIIDAYSKRLQVQERLTKQIADLIQEHLQTQALEVVVSARHTCMTSRGVKRPQSNTITVALRGDIEMLTQMRASEGTYDANGGC